MTDTMRAVVLYGREDARLEQVPIPQPAPGEVRVRIRAALTCGTDLKVFRRGYHARMIVPPAIFGHELASVVDAVGEGVTEWRAGDRVVAANSAPCGRCFFCQREKEELCEDLLFFNGAYAEYACIPRRIVEKNLLRVPDGLSFEAAALTEPLACAVHGVNETHVGPGETVVIIGAGPLGLLLARRARQVGAKVLVLGRRKDRIRAAKLIGAWEALDTESDSDPLDWVRQRTGGYGADRVIEAVGQPSTWELAVKLVRKGGVVNLFGGCASGTSISLDTTRMHYDALTLIGTFHHTPQTIRQALQMLAEDPIPAEVIIRQRATLDELPALLPELARGGGPLKVAIYPEG